MEQTAMKRNFIWYAAGNVIYLLCQWVITILVPILGSFEEAGLLSVAMSVSATFQTVALFGIRNFQVSDIEEKYRDATYAGLRLITCGAAMLLCVGFSLINRYFGIQLLSIMLFMIFRLAENYSDVLHGIAQRRGRLDIAGKSFALKGFGVLIFFVVGYLLSGDLNIGLAMMTGFSLLSMVIYDMPATQRLSRFRLTDSMSRCIKLAQETLPLCIYFFLYVSITTVPKLILEKQCGETVLGIYSSIFAPAMLLQSATAYLYNPFATSFAESWQKRDRRAFYSLLKKIVLAILAVALLALVAAFFLGEFALVLVFGEEIRPHVGFFMPIVVVNIAVAYLGFFCMIAVILRSFRWLLVGCGIGFGLCALLTAPLINLFGPNGASYSLIISIVIGIAVLLGGILLQTRNMKPTEA